MGGILTFPGGSRNWTGRAVTATHIHTPFKAEKVEYFITALTRGIAQRYRAEKLAKVLHFYQGWERVIVAHSNGADVVLNALAFYSTRIRHLHLVSPDVTSDCDENGLAALLADQAVEQATIYVAGRDWPLWLAGLAPTRWLGSGSLGVRYPKGLQRNFLVRREDAFGHSTWWDDEHFDETMRHIWRTS